MLSTEPQSAFALTSAGRFSVGRRLFVGMAALLAVFLVTGTIIYSTSLKLYNISGINTDAARALSTSGYLNNFGARQKYTANDFLITHAEKNRDSYAAARRGFEEAESTLREIFSRDEPALLPFLKAYTDLHDEWQTKVGDVEFELGADADSLVKGRDLLGGRLAQSLSDRSRATGTALGNATQEWADRWSAACLKQLAFLKAVILVGTLAGVAMAAAIAYLLMRSISTPLATIAAAMKTLAGGDLALVIPAVGRRDEIGDVAEAMQVFRVAAKEKLRLEKEATAARDAAEDVRARAEEARADAAKQQAQVLESIAAAFNKLASGDLVHRLNTPFSADYESLRKDFNEAVGRLQLTMKDVFASTGAIRTGTGEIAQASDDLSRRTEQQAASLEETSAALNVITETVKAMAADANRAAEVVATTRHAAESSGAVVQQAVSAMDKIKDSSNQISNIIGVIDEIAFQTNLLALNAGVEAARAGDAGRGFAVVASEVRGLAQRSAEAAKEIKTLISASSDQVLNGVVLVDKAGAALKDITAKVTEMDAIIRQISAASKDQAMGLAEINTAVGQMDKVVQQNAAMVEESAAAVHALEIEAQDLTTVVGRFDVGTDKPGKLGYRSPAHAAKALTSPGLKATPPKATRDAVINMMSSVR